MIYKVNWPLTNDSFSVITAQLRKTLESNDKILEKINNFLAHLDEGSLF